MIIDLGLITEKVIGWSIVKPGVNVLNTRGIQIDYHTEDANLDGQLEANEDIGMAGYGDAAEIAWCTQYGTSDPDLLVMRDENDNGITGNPWRDRFSWTQSSTVFSHFNGTEGNATTLVEAKKPDTEDLNNSGTLDLTNAYLEYVIPIDSASLDPKSRRQTPYIVGGGNKGWYQFDVPLSDFKNVNQLGQSSPVNLNLLTNVQYARIWFKGMQRETIIKIADMNLVGNQWVKQSKVDTTYTVGVVNIEDNPGIYESPVGNNILRQSSPSSTDQNVLSNEQSMALNVRNLLPGQTKIVFKTFATNPLDLINYKIIKLFVDGDPSFQYVNQNNYDASVVVQIGSDSANYYEYTAPIHPDLRPGSPWNSLNEVAITIADLTTIKEFQDTSKTVTYVTDALGPPGAKYGIKGNPSIRSVTQIMLGVRNNNPNPLVTHAITGSVWYDELRVIKTNDQVGYAYNLGASIKMADLGTVDISFQKTDPNFHTLENRFGSLATDFAWQVSTSINAEKIVNALLSRYISLDLKNFISLPITYSHSESFDNPEYLPGTDVSVDNAALALYNQVFDSTHNSNWADYKSNQLRIAAQTLTVTNRFALTDMKFNVESNNFVVSQILDKLDFNFSRSGVTTRSPSLESSYAWTENGSIALNSNLPLTDIVHLNIGKYLPLGDEFKNAKLYFFFPYMPLFPLFANTLSLGAGFTRDRGDQVLRAQLTPSPTTRDFNATRSFSMDWKFIEGWIVDLTGNYSYNAGSDLVYLETTNDTLRQQRSGGAILHDIFFGGGRFINFGRDLNSTQNVTINPKLNIPYLRDVIDLTTSYHSVYGWAANPYNAANGSNVGSSNDFEASAFLKLNKVFDFLKKIGGKDKDKDKSQGGAKSDYQDNNRSIGDLLKILGTFIPDQITVAYSNTRQLTNPAVEGRAGFENFWMSGLGNTTGSGPTRLYQLGFVTDPGLRAPGFQIQDQSALNSSISFNTFITPIFPDNLKISFQYKVGNTSNNAMNYISNPDGSLTNGLQSFQNGRTLSRPCFFVSSDFISKLGGFYDPDPNIQANEISTNFDKSVVSFPFPTWNLSLTGIEKFEMFSSFANTITLQSGYSSEYDKQFTNTGPPLGEYLTQQTLTTGFSPLIGIDVTFKPISEGNLTASFKLNKGNNISLNVSNAIITSTLTSDMSINVSYTKSGFSIPLFGLSLQNDLTIGFSYTRTVNDPTLYNYNTSDGLWDPSPQNGTISTSLNPSIQYALSKSVSLEVFYKYTQVAPTEANSIVITRTTNEAGLNIKLTIQ